MDFLIEKRISNLIESQFPRFYLEDGPNFILFVKAYYEWLEETGNPTYQSRRLLDYRDIDNTLEEYLEYFQKKYLYGIPFNVIVNKRFLLKHILDVYRSKSSIQGYKLLFRLIYNEDVEVYLPGRDILKPSDGTWKEPKYIELTNGILNFNSYVGKTIIGNSTKTTAIIESFVKENYDTYSVNVLYISNVNPKGGNFDVGEKIVLLEDQFNTSAITKAPTILGSLNELEIINGGQNFSVGDIIKIPHRDLSNNQIISNGIEGLLKVTALTRGVGTLFFNIEDGGFGYTTNSNVFLYKNDANGNGASFNIGLLSSTQTIEYNTDVICDYANLTLNSTTFGFPGNTSANLSSTICFTYTNNTFGTIFTLKDIKTGSNYDQPANVFVRSTLLSNTLQGNLTYTTSSNTITGTSTIFDNIFVNNSVIMIQADSSNNNTRELHVIKEVTNSTQIILYTSPTYNSVSNAQYRAAPVILPSNYALYSNVMFRTDGKINGQNEIITAYPSVGNDVVKTTTVVSSGKNYIDGETVKAYLYGAVSNTINILNGGSNYTNGDLLVFSTFGSGKSANGYVTTNTSGGIISTTLTFAGSGYTSTPTVTVKSSNGVGAVLTVSLTEYNTSSEIIGKVKKVGIGKSRGYWSTTRSFLNSDKYIQDSYYYQDYSYELRVAKTLNIYKSILYDTFHTSGTELFGKFLLIDKNSSEANLIFESNTANTTLLSYFQSDGTTITCDSNTITITVDRVTF